MSGFFDFKEFIPKIVEKSDVEHYQDNYYTIYTNINRLINRLGIIRTEFGKPIYITSGYRPPEYNKSVGGVKNSYHIKGRACDITADDFDSLVACLYKLKEDDVLSLVEFIVYLDKKFIHLAF